MQIQPITAPSFVKYGRVVREQAFDALFDALEQFTPKPEGATVYVASEPRLEELPAFSSLQDVFYGGMPIQIGYCNGDNRKLNCLEYHRGSEINLAMDDVVLLVASLQKVQENMLDTGEIEAFLLPKGTAALLYETTLHYAPCCAPKNSGFRVAIVLPRGTNGEKPAEKSDTEAENQLLWACNKWLLAHPDSNEAKLGAFAGLKGKNLEIE